MIEEARLDLTERKRTPPSAPESTLAPSRRSSEALLEALYGDLRRLARRSMAGEAAGQTLQPTALVHEAYLRLAGEERAHPWANARQFASAAATAMRRILVERARAKHRLKRGGDRRRVALGEVEPAGEGPEEHVVRLAEALEILSAIDPRAVEVIQLRYFAGLDVAETAAVLGISERSVRREWEAARLWLARKLEPDREARVDHAS